MTADKEELSENADRALLFLYVIAKGLPELSALGTDQKTAQMTTFQKISGLSEAEVAAAYAELEDAGMIEEG